MKTLTNQAGWTIVELMIALTLGLLVVLAATGLLLSSKAGYLVQDQSTQVQETGRYAMEVLARAIRQAGYENLNTVLLPLRNTADFSPNVIGLDAASLQRTGAALAVAAAASVVHGSDVLALRFFGDEEAILNCAGLLVPVASSQHSADEERGWSIFFVAKDSGGEPELQCKYRSKNAWATDAIARGIESFQVLYGVDLDGDGVVDRFINAKEIDALDQAMPLAGLNAVARAADRNRKTHWKKIRAIRVALLVRSEQRVRNDALDGEHRLFGSSYDHPDDKGTTIREQDLPASERARLRKIFTQTIQLRNGIAEDISRQVVVPGKAGSGG